MSNHYHRSLNGLVWLIHILPTQQGMCFRSRPCSAIQRKELDPSLGRLLRQIISQPHKVLLPFFQWSIGAVLWDQDGMPAPDEGCQATQHREG